MSRLAEWIACVVAAGSLLGCTAEVEPVQKAAGPAPADPKDAAAEQPGQDGAADPVEPAAPAQPPAAPAPPAPGKDWKVIPCHLPRDKGLEVEGPDTPLPVRVTLYWNVATQQSKVYIGQTFCGIADQGGMTRGMLKAKQILPTTKIAEIDATDWLPARYALRALDELRTVGFDPIALAAGDQQTNKPPLSGAAGTLPAGWTARAPVATPSAVPLADAIAGQKLSDVLHVYVDGVGDRVALQRGGEEPYTADGPGLVKALKVHAALERDPKNAMLSTRAVVIHPDAETQWGQLRMVVERCAIEGIWNISFGPASLK